MRPGPAGRRASASRACGACLIRLEVSALTSDPSEFPDIAPTAFLHSYYGGRLPLDALDRRPGGGTSWGGRSGALGRLLYARNPPEGNSR